MDGFCPNEVPIELKVSPNDPLYDAKQAFWSRGESDANGVLAGNHPANITAAVAAAVESARTQHLDPTLAIHSAMQAAVSAAANDVRKVKRHGQSQWQPGNNGNARSSTSSPNMNSTLDTKKRIRICVSNNENTRVLFSMLRVLACNEEELCTISSSATLPFGDSGCSGFLNRALRGFTGGHISESNTTNMQNVALFRTARDIRHPLGLRNEKAAMECLLNIIKGHLDLYPCSLAQDMADLMDEDSHPRFSNRRHAKIQVRGEKEVLHHFAVWAQTAIDVIDIIEREIRIANGETDMNTTTATDTATAMANNNSQLLTIPPQQGFEYITHMMEEEEGVGPNGLHHTIVRYCCDVLGALRKEALKDTKRGREAAKLQESRRSKKI